MTASRLQHFAVSLSFFLLTFSALSGSTLAASSDTKETAPEPCTVRSPSSHSFFDLNSIARSPATEKDYERHKDDPDWERKSYHVKGHDYGANFTINFCNPVVERLDEVYKVEKDLWKNVSAFYEKDGTIYSIGQQNAEPVFRGRKLVLNYTDGSPCPRGGLDERSPTLGHSHDLKRFQARAIGGQRHKSLLRHEAAEVEMAKQRAGIKSALEDDDEADDHRPSPGTSNDSKTHDSDRRKSTILSLMCEKDPLAPPAAVSFVGTMDECTYFFEVRTHAACAGVKPPTQSLGPGSVFSVIALIAVMVYVIGGCVYQRTVMHQRGWRQVPNYAMWSSCWSGFSDCFVIATSSCARWLPRRKGYSRVSNVPNGYGRGRHNHNHSDDENRLIDQLDEEWDD